MRPSSTSVHADLLAASIAKYLAEVAEQSKLQIAWTFFQSARKSIVFF